MSKKSVILTGATGLVGSRFVDLFADQFDIHNLDLATGVDITDQKQVEAFLIAHPADTIIHLAAFTDTNRAFAESGDKTGICYRVNVEGTRNIAEACRQRSLFMIHVSTDFIFDGTKTTPYIESDPPSPIEWYGETKALAEQAVAQSGVNNAIVRIAYPYRAHFELKPDLIQKIRTGLETGKLYPQFSDTLITPTFIDDIAAGFAQLVATPKSGIFHFTGSTALSPFELARKVATAYGFDPVLVKEGSLTEYLKSAARPFARKVAMSNAKATSELGLHFATIDEGLSALKAQA